LIEWFTDNYEEYDLDLDRISEPGYLADAISDFAGKQADSSRGEDWVDGRRESIRKAFNKMNLTNQLQDGAELINEMDGVGDLDRTVDEFENIPDNPLKEDLYKQKLEEIAKIREEIKSVKSVSDREKLENIKKSIPPSYRDLLKNSIKKKEESLDDFSKQQKTFLQNLDNNLLAERNALNLQGTRKVKAFRDFNNLTDEEAIVALDSMGVKHENGNIIRKDGFLVDAQTGEIIPKQPLGYKF